MNEPNETTMKPEAGQAFAPPDCSASRLWRVTVEYELLVVADNEREAESEGEYYAGEDGSEPGMVIAHQVRTVEEIPREWRQAIPFGGDRDDERTCVERVTQNEQAEASGARGRPIANPDAPAALPPARS